MFIVVWGLRRPGVDAACSVDELFDGDVAIAALAVEVTGFRRCVFHIEWVVPSFSGLVKRDIVSAVSLVDIYFTLKCKRSQLPRPLMRLEQKAAGDVPTDGGMRTFSAI